MVFSSLLFILLFLPLLIIVYYAIPKRFVAMRKYLLLFFSILFYASGEPTYVFVIFTCVCITWILSKAIEQRYKFIFLLAIVLNLFPLFFLKYLGFSISNINIILGTNIKEVSLIMPIGISFYTFQMMTYIVDLYYEGFLVKKI